MSEENLNQETFEETTQALENIESKVESSNVENDSNQVQQNFKSLRESKRKIEQERDEALAKLKALESKSKEEEDYSDDESEIAKLKQELRQYQINTTAVATEVKLKSQYPDFDKIVNKDNIDILNNDYPEIAKTIQSSNDLYSKAVTAYTLIKKLGIHLDDEIVNQGKKIQDNLSKPKPTGIIKTDSPLKHAKDYSDLSDKSVRDEIIKRALKISRNA